MRAYIYMHESKWGDLFLLRHGIAEKRSFNSEDPLRPLTEQGVHRTTLMLKKLRELGFVADELFTSPYLRAKQTGEIALKVGLSKKLQITKLLEPGGDPWKLIKGITGRCCLIGHEPDLSNLGALLIGAQPGALVLKKAGFAHIKLIKTSQDSFLGQGELLTLIKPSLLLQPYD